MDFLSGFTPVGKLDTIWVIVDRFTKRMHMIPISKSITAEELATLFIDRIFRLHGLPAEIISDRDVLFTSTFWHTFFQSLSVHLKLSTPFHPQTDGQTERGNRTIIQLLRALFDFNTQEWIKQLPIVEFSYNSHVHSSTGFSPFVLDLGYQPTSPHIDTRLINQTQLNNAGKSGRHLAELLHTYNQVALDKLQETQEVSEKYYNRKHQELLLEVGQLVLVHRRARLLGSSFKFTKDYNLYFGPFKVLQKMPNNNNVYELDLDRAYGKTGQSSRLVNVKNLRPYYHVLDKNTTPPPASVPQLKRFATNNWISAIVGIDVLNQTVALTFRQCPEYHAAIFKARDARQAMSPELWDQLLNKFKLDCEDPPPLPSTIEELPPVDAMTRSEHIPTSSVSSYSPVLDDIPMDLS
ncbi:hypothetical protein G210_3392 [Candida maltosa Xu316]|uniref:Integrase catalytic domain-containing protein n=1 Tax=Candida maltosa (strain Xu316) TaxID=1245528 RepID=M3IJ06_CANMX|nr:hypothetical protein G210_3392 [Candida maltosa Xu316]